MLLDYIIYNYFTHRLRRRYLHRGPWKRVKWRYSPLRNNLYGHQLFYCIVSIYVFVYVSCDSAYKASPSYWLSMFRTRDYKCICHSIQQKELSEKHDREMMVKEARLIELSSLIGSYEQIKTTSQQVSIHIISCSLRIVISVDWPYSGTCVVACLCSSTLIDWLIFAVIL